MKTGKIIKVAGPLVVAEGMEEANIFDMVKVGEKEVVVENIINSEILSIPADRIILSLGGRPNDDLYNELTDKLPKVYQLGDSIKVGRIAQAVQTGFERAYVME